MRVLGLMSGTSADGVDLVLAEFRGRPPRVVHRVLEHLEVPYPEGLRKRVLAAMRGADTREIALLHHDLGRFYLEAALPFRGKAELVALSGQTVWHEPPRATFQLGEPSHLALGLGVPVVHGFRAVDLAAGGQGLLWWPTPTSSSLGRRASGWRCTTWGHLQPHLLPGPGPPNPPGLRHRPWGLPL